MTASVEKQVPSGASWDAVGGQSFGAMYRLDVPARVALVREGAPAELLATIAERTGLSREPLYRSLGLAPSTIKRKIQSHQPLAADESESALGVARLIGQVETMLAESADASDFDAAKWLGRWLERPNAALDGARPISYLDTADGRQMVADLLARMQTGAYS
jgi:putative toxin-antitoxin system antitoxin component (TIGR02293 family)